MAPNVVPCRQPEFQMQDRLVYDIPEVAKLLRVSRHSADEAARRGDIPTIRH